MSRTWPAVLGYLAAFGVLAVPWIRESSDSVPWGNPFAFTDDARFFVWLLGWVAHALANDPWNLLNANIHHPAPLQLTGSEHLASTQLLAVPAVWLTGNPILVANWIVLASYPLAAIAMWRLLRVLGCEGLVAWVGGFLFALGPMRVPGNLQVLHFLNVHLALAALALERLRSDPRAARVVILALVLIAAMLSGYYMAAMVALVGAIWTVFLAVEPHRPSAARFVALAALAAAVALPVVVLVSLPYFGRPDLQVARKIGGIMALDPASTPIAAVRLYLTLLFGLVPGCLAIVGLGGLVSRSTVARRLAIRGTVIAVAGLVIVFPPAGLVALIEASPLRFLRAQFRFATVSGLGTALLAAAALQSLHARLGVRAAQAAAVAVAAAMTMTLGAVLPGKPDRVMAAGTDRPVYDAVAELTAREGSGPLLELPLVDAHPGTREGMLPVGKMESEAMIGSLWHHQPLVTGHTGYQPMHREVLVAALDLLPRTDALDEIIDLTHVRWLLLRPEDFWRDPRVRRGLLSAPGVTVRLQRAGWTLARIDRPVRRSEWYAAIAAGYRLDRSVLGTPVARLPEEAAVAEVTLSSPAPTVLAPGGIVAVQVQARNAGSAPWPVVVPAGAQDAHPVRLVVGWRRDTDSPSLEPLALRRDVPVGDTIAQVVFLRAPQAAGAYSVEIGVEQEEGARFTAPGNLRVRVDVNVTGVAS